MTSHFQALQQQEKELLHSDPFPNWYPAMLATLTDRRFSDSTWIYEPKFDGERAFAYLHSGEIRLLSRNQQNLNKTYPDLLDVLLNQDAETFILDGEIVAFEGELTSFSKLQQRLGVREISLQKAYEAPVYYYIFDILYLDGFDLRKLPLRGRQILLKTVIQYKDPLRLTEGVTEEGLKYYQEACEKGWEGVIVKRLDSPYQNKRSMDWLKFKCHKSQELIIIGYTSPKGQREGFGALVVGYYDNDELKCAGKVGTGFTRDILISLKKEMDQCISIQPPIKKSAKVPKNTTWLKPKLVGEFDFTEWTRDGKLRHPRFKGLRYDKEAQAVIREAPQ
ncbi:MAG: non-homologous end-joining DNA ligase [Candidatus Nucleicultricaceae bacterium]